MGAADAGGLPRAGLRLSRGRRLAGLAVVVLGAPTLTAVLVGRGLALGAVLLLYLLVVVAAAAVGGIEPALLGAVVSFGLANWFFAEPAYTFTVASRDSLVELTAFLLVAAVVAVWVQVAAREQTRAARSAYESRLIARMSAEPVAEQTVAGVLTQVRELLAMNAVALVPTGHPDRPIETVGDPGDGPPVLVLHADDDTELLAWGPEPFGADRRLLTSLAGAAARAHGAALLSAQAARATELATADKVRTGLLAAVGHDLRSPLAAIKAAVSSLRADDVQWEPAEQAELLASIEDGADRLSALVANLLDLSRLQAGSMPVLIQVVGVDEVVALALLHRSDVDVELRDDLPLVLADPGLLERVVANLVDNARRYASADQVQVSATAGPDAVRLAVTDHGPGVPPDQWKRMFVPFQRLDDRSTTTGLGLGLAIAVGFAEAMGATLTPSTTPGGGLTMTVELRRATPVRAIA
ncbi:MAG: DUF4118 domain-containing protein [Cellulomonas sp.]|nr:DUF4118 domain-containing protein [Cellulomonas sp.]